MRHWCLARRPGPGNLCAQNGDRLCILAMVVIEIVQS